MIEQLIEDVLEGLDPRDCIEELLDEDAPKDPKQRALYRIQALMDRFDSVAKVDQHTALRAKKCKNVEKLKGIIWAAKKLKLKGAVAAAERQLALVG